MKPSAPLAANPQPKAGPGSERQDDPEAEPSRVPNAAAAPHHEGDAAPGKTARTEPASVLHGNAKPAGASGGAPDAGPGQAAQPASTVAPGPLQAASIHLGEGGLGALNPGEPPAAAAAAAPSQAVLAPASQAAGAPQPAIPVDQLGQAAAGLHLGGGAGGHVSIRLNPQELGGVEIQLRRSQDGASTLSLAVERPETLRALQADLSHLHQALDRAGLPAEQCSVTLHLAAGDGGAAQAGGGGFGTANQGGGGSSPGYQRPGQPQARQEGTPTSEAAGIPVATASSGPGWRASGFDITA